MFNSYGELLVTMLFITMLGGIVSQFIDKGADTR